MATQGKVASRYAKALLGQLRDGKNANGILGELEAFSNAIASHSELSLVVHSPGFSEQQKTSVAQDVAAKMKMSQDSIQILTAIAKMGRLTQLAPILKRLRVLLLASENIQPIQVWTAGAVSADEKKSIEDKFAKLLGKKVEATYESRTGLVGGLKVVAGGRTYDGTVSGWLETLKDSLVEGEV